MKALLLIDIQNDFLPGGALAVPAGDEVIAVANRLMPKYEFVVATQDWHPASHESFASQHAGSSVGEIEQVNGLDQILWPEHCVQGSHRAQLAAGLERDKIHHIVRKGTDPQLTAMRAFFDNARRKSTGLAEFLRMKGVDEIHVLGLATDYCVARPCWTDSPWIPRRVADRRHPRRRPAKRRLRAQSKRCASRRDYPIASQLLPIRW